MSKYEVGHHNRRRVFGHVSLLSHLVHSDTQLRVQQRPLTEVITRAKNQEISEIVVDGERLTIIPRTDAAGLVRLTSRIGADTDLLNLLVNNGVDIGSGGLKVTFKGTGELDSFIGLIINFLPLIVFLWTLVVITPLIVSLWTLVVITKGLGRITVALKEVAEAIASNPRT